MSKYLIIGKDLPDGLDFVSSLAADGNSIFTVEADSNSDEFPQEISVATWNKSSAISTHSLLIKAETKLDKIENVILYFDSDYFSSQFAENRADEISTAIDNMINPFLFSTSELLKRIDQLKEKTCVSFLVKNHNSKETSGIVSIAQAAFCQLAENFANNVASRDYLRVFLAKSSAATETCGTEAQLSKWLTESMEIISSAKKQSPKQAASWNKAGGKVSSGFLIFK